MPPLSTVMAQPPIRNMLLGPVRNGQLVDVAMLPLGEHLKHVGMVHIVRIDDVYVVPDASPENTVDGARTRWKEDGVYADVTLSSGAPTTDVPVPFLMRDKILLVSLTMKTLSAQVPVARIIPGMERAHVGSAKEAHRPVLG